MPKQLFAEYPLVFYVSIVTLAYLLVRFSIPSIIHAANKHRLFDSVDLHRKEHKENISRLGGIGLFLWVYYYRITICNYGTLSSS